MKVRFNCLIMKKLFIIAAIALLGGMMTACSSSDDEFDVEQVEYGIDDEQHFYLKGDSKENNSEGEYYYVTEFFPDSMTTFSPNSPELLQYKKYKKIGGRP